MEHGDASLPKDVSQPNQPSVDGTHADYSTMLQHLSSTCPELADELRKLDLLHLSHSYASTSSPQSSGVFVADPPSIPDFKLLRLVGRGGFGDVWLSENLHDRQFYAVKVLELAEKLFIHF